MNKYFFLVYLSIAIILFSCKNRLEKTIESEKEQTKLDTFQIVKSFKLIESKKLNNKKEKFQKYLNLDSITIDVFTFPILKQEKNSDFSPIDIEVFSFLASIPKLIEYGLYDSLVAESSINVYYNIEGHQIQGKRVILDGTQKGLDIKSIYVIVEGNSSMLHSFRHTASEDKYDQRTVDIFISNWLVNEIGKKDLSIKISDEGISADNIFIDSNYDILLEKYAGKRLGHFSHNKSLITINDATYEDQDIFNAILYHELSHAAYITEESIDRKIYDVCTTYGIKLTENDYLVYGKNELMADLTTLSLLKRIRTNEAVLKYGIIRGIRREIIKEFLKYEIKKNKN